MNCSKNKCREVSGGAPGACAARSWTGRRCVLQHEDDVHRSGDGVRWRGNADAVPMGSGAVPDDVREAFLKCVEITTAIANGYDLCDLRGGAWLDLSDVLAKHCGVTWAWNSTWAWYWAGDWPSEWDVGGAYHGVYPEGIEHNNHKNIWRGRAWGCAVEKPWEF